MQIIRTFINDIDVEPYGIVGVNISEELHYAHKYTKDEPFGVVCDTNGITSSVILLGQCKVKIYKNTKVGDTLAEVIREYGRVKLIAEENGNADDVINCVIVDNLWIGV